MTRNEFVDTLRARLSRLPEADRERAVAYYTEMIEDRMEDGMTEETAVAALGPIEDIIKQTLKSVPLSRLVKERVRPRRMLSAGEIALIVLGSPVWFPILLAVCAVALSVYVVLIFAVGITLFAVTAALYGVAVGGAVGGIALLATGETAAGLVTLGGALVALAVGLLFTVVLVPATKVCLALHKKAIGKIKLWLFEKERRA